MRRLYARRHEAGLGIRVFFLGVFASATTYGCFTLWKASRDLQRAIDSTKPQGR